MIISIANFVEDPKIKQVIKQSDDIRTKALDYCYTHIKQYDQMSIEEKNQHYDSVVKNLLKKC